ncbi:MAG: hypothetical protein ABSG72_01790 [Candidatus Sulfotelmatobacter sp.]|jgi:hypothetical protein
MIFLAALVVHLPLLLMKLPLKSYDANFHIFFASHYLHNWFDPWNPKWYAGFSQTTYPPLPQQLLALTSHLVGLDMAYMAVQFVAILLLALGVYRFSLLWVDRRAAAFAALASVFLGSECFLVYSAGQLSTTFAAPLYLNALPYLFRWVRHGEWRSFLKGGALFVAAAAAHHATLLFGSLLFALPVLALVIFDRQSLGGRSLDSHNLDRHNLDRHNLDSHNLDAQDVKRLSAPAFLLRTGLITLCVGAAVALVLLPFWIALIHYPVTQTPIPHASRANFLLSPQWGLNYFVVPYGALILVLPFIVLRGSSIARLRPLLMGFWLAFLIGLGGTTPVGRLVLGRAFDVLTMERFSYWATLLALPFVGLLATELIDRFRMRAVVGLTVAASMSCALAVGWATYRPADASDFSVDSVASWLNRDGHDRYRYVTLGFGNKISRLAVLTDASSVDGEWNSGRMLPELTQHGGAALTSSKYFGEAGLDALSAILHHADRYGLKWVFARDPYYEPLLVFAGWRKVDELEDKTVTVWSKDDVPPAVSVNAPQIPPHWQGLMWGTLPIGSSLVALLLVVIPEKRWLRGRVVQPVAQPIGQPVAQPVAEPATLVAQRLVS